MSWNFDEEVNRENSDCIKYDLRRETFGNEDVIPLWVADMDFPVPDFIIRALLSRTEHPVFGYSFRPPEYFTSIIDWTFRKHGWELQREWICFSPGIVPALNLSTLAFTSPGDHVIVQPPVYFPFFSAVEAHGRRLLYNPLIESSGKWEMDFDNLETLLRFDPKMMIISNPHNPVGRAWREEELRRLAGFCLENRILLLSDEIHCDLVLPGYRHTPVALLGDEIAANTITFIAPSKTFNLAGLYTSSVIISDASRRKAFNSMIDKLHIGGGNIFGNIASTAAYSHGDQWLGDLLDYIGSNAAFVTDFCREYLPEIRVTPVEATYLLWLDCRNFGMSGKELREFFISRAGIGMNEGSTFGPGGEGFMRMNIACTRKTLSKAMKQIEAAVINLR